MLGLVVASISLAVSELGGFCYMLPLTEFFFGKTQEIASDGFGPHVSKHRHASAQ